MKHRHPSSLGRLAVLALTGACATTELAAGGSHPANPDAPSGKVPTTTALASGSDATPRVPAAQPSHDHAAESKTLYTCPMHPEIVRDAPGKCPICGMALVPKKDKK